jgi:branched-chain amino acid transport system substrate-binding protein
MDRRLFLRSAAACAASATGSALAETRGKWVLGQSAALSGPSGELGQQFRLGAELCFGRVNARGGVAGRPIELRTLDDGYEPDRCAANTRKLLGEGVFALFGYVGTPTSLAALPLATAAGVPFLAPMTGAEALRTPFNRNVFHVRASYIQETAEIVKQLTSVGVKRIAVFYQADAYGQAGVDGVTRALATLGLKPAALGTVERNSVDVSGALRSIMAEPPEAVVQIGSYKACAAFIRAARADGFRGAFYNVSFVGTKALADELGADAQGVIISQVMPYPFSTAKPITAEYQAAGRAAQGDAFAPSYGSMEGYIAAKVVVDGLHRAGPNATAESLITGLEAMHDFDLGGFFVDFNASKHTGSRFVDMTILDGQGKVRR